MGELRPARTDDLVQAVGAQGSEERPQRADERRIWQAGVTELEAAADEDVRSGLAGALAELGDQPRLADAGLAADQAGGRPMIRREIEGLAQAVELRGPSDEDGAADACH